MRKTRLDSVTETVRKTTMSLMSMPVLGATFAVDRQTQRQMGSSNLGPGPCLESLSFGLYKGQESSDRQPQPMQ